MICGTTVICRHASDQQSESCTRPISHSALPMKMGQVPTERMKHTQATSLGCRVTNVKMPSYDAIFSWSKKTALFGVSPLVSQLSLSSFALNLDMSLTSETVRWTMTMLGDGLDPASDFISTHLWIEQLLGNRGGLYKLYLPCCAMLCCLMKTARVLLNCQHWQ